MFSWFVSLLLLFGYHGKAVNAPYVDLNGSGNRHVTPADSTQPERQRATDSDGTGGKGSGHP
jgi:hypothetical protein